MNLAGQILQGHARLRERAAMSCVRLRPIRTHAEKLARAGTAARSDAGLVPSINNAETLVINHTEARCTRLRKNLGVAAKWLSKGAGQAWMLTFTYRDDVEWEGCHVREAITHLRKWLKRAYGWTLRYLWVMETVARKSGARVGEFRPHYHCVVWVPRDLDTRDLALDSLGWWPHGMTNAVKAVAAVRYVMKYASKFEDGNHFPKGARVYGIGGLDRDGRRCRRWINWPAFVQARASVACPWRRAVGGGWVDGDGVVWPSEWAATGHHQGHTRIIRVRSYPRPDVPPSGPFSFLPGVSALQGIA